jgi:hypothetical protein
LADLIVNSITADARTINVRFSVHSDPCIAVIDDGTGMSSAELTGAMRHQLAVVLSTIPPSKSLYSTNSRATLESGRKPASAWLIYF